MEYNSKMNNVEEGIDLQTITQYAVRVIQKWWIILIAAVVCAGIGFGVAKLNYVPSYTCTMRFTVDNKTENTVTAGQSASDISASSQLARNYLYIMTESSSLMDLVAKNSGYKVNGEELTGKDVKRMVSSTLVEDTSIIAISITSSDPDVSYAVATSYVNNFRTITEEAYPSTYAKNYDPPVRPEAPNGNNTTLLYTLLGFMFGAGVVVLAICLIIFIKDTIKSSDDITKKLGSKMLGSIISIKKSGKDADKQNILITDRKNGFMFIEAFKLIRTKIENVAKRQNYKVFTITSASENEGKTTISTNTALALAQNGKSVLLIDGDLRKPSVYKTLGVSAANEAGLAGVVRGEKSLSESIKYFEKFNLFLLISSQPVNDSAELLASDEAQEIIEAVKNEFDYVIIDTPPAGLVADAAIVTQYADACMVVVRNDHSPIRRIKKAIEDMSATGKEVIGCIYNGTEVSVANKFIKTARKSNKGYGYGYGYGEDKKSKK